MGIETSDDAAIYKVTDEIAMIQTVDFFTPIVDDPYTFGQIAAANSLSDVYAMGGEPKIALNIVGFPNCLDPEILGEAEMASEAAIKEAITVMSSLNKKGKEVVEHYPVTACTDITGFGLLGHCVEMASASDVTFELQVKDIAYLEEAVSYAKMGLVPAGAYKNREYSAEMVDMEHVEEHYIDLLYDPQTSGGLLISVSPEYVDDIMKAFEEKNMDTKVSIIGKVVEKGDKLIRLY